MLIFGYRNLITKKWQGESMKYQKIIKEMSLKEKAAFLSGKDEWQSRDIERLDIPAITFADGPHGIRRQIGEGDHLGLNPSTPATCFPTAATVANTWNEDLGEAIGEALGQEAVCQGVNVLLGPGLNIKRNPLCGRNFEYFSEDPYLSGKMAAAYIRGIQSQGVYACPKHFAANNQELRRMTSNSVLDERTLRELYLTGFEIAVREGKPKAIMSSYNKVNGVYANENKQLLTDILRGEWGFDGIVVTDWGGSNDHVRGVAAGSTLEMPVPGFASAAELQKAVKEGRLDEKDLDLRVDELLDAVFTCNTKNIRRGKSKKKHHELARVVAQEGIVLLKNKDSILPLNKEKSVAFIGDFAKYPRLQGAGSSKVNAYQEDSVAELLPQYGLRVAGISKGYDREKRRAKKLWKETSELASRADIIVCFFGLDEISEIEGMDRSHMKIPKEQTELLKKLTHIHENIIVVITGGAPVEMDWKEQCKGILHGYLPGQAGAGALLDILAGKINPSGKLAETYPERYEDVPNFYYYPGRRRNAEYREGVYVGYRYYITRNVPVCFPFGFGLSYTEFTYTDLSVKKDKVSFTVKNTGARDGAEIAQMYVGLPEAKVFRPSRELKGFAKVFLKMGESRGIEISFDDKTFRYWNVKSRKWEQENGEYIISIGASAEDIRLSGTYLLDGSETMCPYDREQLPSYYEGKVRRITEAEFTNLLGAPIPEDKWSDELGINDALSQMIYAKSRMARIICKLFIQRKNYFERKGVPDLNSIFIYNMSFRALTKMTEGAIDTVMVNGILEMVNGRFLKGIRMFFAGAIRNRKRNKKYRALFGRALKDTRR